MRKTLLVLSFSIVGMFGFGYALVPIYNIVCEALGINGKVQLTAELETEEAIAPFDVSLRLFAQAADAGWQIEALEPSKQIETQQQYTVYYQITNQLNVARSGRAVPNINPIAAAGSVKKIQCFCMDILAFNPGESKQVSVTFFLDAHMSPKIEEVSLGYSMFDYVATP